MVMVRSHANISNTLAGIFFTLHHMNCEVGCLNVYILYFLL